MTEHTDQTEPHATDPKTSPRTIVMTVAIFLVIGFLIASIITSDSDNTDEIDLAVAYAVGTQVAEIQLSATPRPPTPTRVPNLIASEDDAFLGSDDARVVIVEFSDFQCGYCGRFSRETLPQILNAYPNDVKFVYRDFPIFGEDSARAAMATECAEEKGQFWAMHDRIFEALSDGDRPTFNHETLVGFAENLELDASAFAECLSSERYLDEVIADHQAALAYGFSGTPAFLINGVPVSGAQPFSVFERLIKREIARASS